VEGPSFRKCPRTLLCCPVEIRAGEKAIHLEQAVGDLSTGGLCVNAEPLPMNTPVRIRMAASPDFEAEGVVRSCDAGGVHIEFTRVTEANRQRLDQIIADFAQREVRAS